MRLSPEIIIRVRPWIRGSRRPDVPHVATPQERYNDFREKHLRTLELAPGNNFPWKWRKPTPIESNVEADAEQHF